MHLLDFLFEILYKTIKNIKTNEIFKGTVNVISSDPAFINYLIHPAFINCLIHNCKNQGYLIQSKDWVVPLWIDQSINVESLEITYTVSYLA